MTVDVSFAGDFRIGGILIRIRQRGQSVSLLVDGAEEELLTPDQARDLATIINVASRLAREEPKK